MAEDLCTDLQQQCLALSLIFENNLYGRLC